MEHPQIPAPENEVRYLLSLLRIAHPGEQASQQTQSLEELLAGESNR
jgi:hypothetical protein